MVCPTRLEEELQRQLQDARVVRAVRVQKTLAKTAGIARRIVGAAITTDRVVDAAPLRVIEHVEGFGAELEIGPLIQEEVLEQTRVHVPTPGIIHEVAAGISECQTGRRGESS